MSKSVAAAVESDFSLGRRTLSPEAWRRVQGIADPERRLRLAAGRHHALLLTLDGRVYAWGANEKGQLGYGNTYGFDVPIEVYGLSGVTAIGARGDHSVAVTVGSSETHSGVWEWGERYVGGGAVDAAPREVPTARSLPGFPWPWSAVAPMDDGAAVKSGGYSSWRWGARLDENHAETTGLDHVHFYSGSGVQVAGGGDHLAHYSSSATGAQGFHLYGASQWEKDAARMFLPENDPVGIRAIGAGGNFTVVLRNDGTVWSWGSGRYGQMGDGDASSAPRRTPVRALIDDVVQIAAGPGHVLYVRADGSVWTTGLQRVVGDDRLCFTRPGQVPRLEVDPAHPGSVAAGSTCSLALRKRVSSQGLGQVGRDLTTYEVVGWGMSRQGELLRRETYLDEPAALSIDPS